MHSNESNGKKILLYSILIILMVSCFTGWRYYVDEPLNEDLGGYFFTNSDGIRARITTFGQVIYCVKYTYLNWSGRIPGYFLISISKLFPRSVSAVACALIFSANVILTIRIIVKDTKKAFSSPILFLVLYLALYWYRPYIGVSYRWEFVAIYSFTVSLVLLYYNMTSTRFAPDDPGPEVKENSRMRILTLCLIQLFGIITGMCHEILSFGLIALLGTEWIVDLIRHRTKAASLFRHWGLVLGYLIGLLAPGNLQRFNSDWTQNAYSTAKLPHFSFPISGGFSYLLASAEQVADNSLSESMSGFAAVLSGFIRRIGPSFDMHEITIMGVGGGYRQEYKLFLLLFALAVIVMVYMLKHGQKKAVLDMIVNDIGFIVSSLSSVLMWAFIYWQPSYVVWLPTIFVYAAILEFVIRIPDIFSGMDGSNRISHACKLLQIVIPVIMIIAFICLYDSEVMSFARTSLARRARIAYAQENGLTEINIPRYDENLSPMRYSMYCLNDQEEYDLAKNYKLFYGVRLIIENE